MYVFRYCFQLALIMGLALPIGGCSLFRSEGGTPEAKATALVFANGFLTAILNGQIDRVNTLIIWSRYLDENDDIKQEALLQEVLESQKAFTLQNHPLFNLTVNDIRMRGDNVRIIFQRIDGPVRPTVEVHLIWAVNGWGIVDDNIFGEGGVLREASQSIQKK